MDFAARDHVRTRALIRQQAQHRKAWIGLDRIMDGRREVFEGVGEGLVLCAYPGSRIAVARGFEGIGYGGQGDVLNMQEIALITDVPGCRHRQGA